MHLHVQGGVFDFDECANGFPDMNLIKTRALETTTGEILEEGLSLLNAFTCNGTLTGLVLGVDVRTEAGSRSMYPQISLWRPQDAEELDEVNDIVDGSTRTVQLTPANFSTSGAFDYTIAPPLDFQANDILGWTQPEEDESVVRMYTIDDSGNSNVLLLYPVVVTGKLQFFFLDSTTLG